MLVSMPPSVRNRPPSSCGSPSGSVPCASLCPGPGRHCLTGHFTGRPAACAQGDWRERCPSSQPRGPSNSASGVVRIAAVAIHQDDEASSLCRARMSEADGDERADRRDQDHEHREQPTRGAGDHRRGREVQPHKHRRREERQHDVAEDVLQGRLRSMSTRIALVRSSKHVSGCGCSGLTAGSAEGLSSGSTPHDDGPRLEERDQRERMGLDEMKDALGGFDHPAHDDEVRERWGGTEAYRESTRRTRRYTEEDWTRFKAESDGVNRAVAELIDEGVAPTTLGPRTRSSATVFSSTAGSTPALAPCTRSSARCTSPTCASRRPTRRSAPAWRASYATRRRRTRRGRRNPD